MPRVSFTLRDLFWLTLLVGMGVGWWVDHNRQRSDREAIVDAITSDQRLILDMDRALNIRFSDKGEVRARLNGALGATARESSVSFVSNAAFADSFFSLSANRSLWAKPSTELLISLAGPGE
jgi:hypothetical protein